MVHTVWSYWFVIYWFSEMKISQQNVKVNANLPTWIVHCRAPTPTASWNAEERWPIVPKVRDLKTIYDFNEEYSIPDTFTQDCPCNVNCPNGCDGCPNTICVCGENPLPQNEDNLQQCKKETSIDLGQCIIDCKNDEPCEKSCVALFKEQYAQCPCQVRRSENFLDLRRLKKNLEIY